MTGITCRFHRDGGCKGPGAPWIPALALLLMLTLMLMLIPTVALARSTLSLPYSPPDVWATAVRFLRVDRGYPIREKDEPTAYILFDYLDGARSYRGALELVPLTDIDGRPNTQAVLSIPDLPRHYETALLDRLAAKAREERGTPPSPRRRPPAVDPGDKDKRPPLPDGGLPRAPGAESW